MGFGVPGASNEGAIIALRDGEVMEDSGMYSTPITLASHGNRHNGSLFSIFNHSLPKAEERNKDSLTQP
jgi:hypothetical protein